MRLRVWRPIGHKHREVVIAATGELVVQLEGGAPGRGVGRERSEADFEVGATVYDGRVSRVNAHLVSHCEDFRLVGVIREVSGGLHFQDLGQGDIAIVGALIVCVGPRSRSLCFCEGHPGAGVANE